jgi:hypothetical protein
MAIVHLAARKTTEAEVALHQRLERIDGLELWFDVTVAGASQPDIVLLHRSAGIFVIEVKAVTLDVIESVGPTRLTIWGPDHIDLAT